MSDPDAPPLDRAAIFTAMARHGVKFVLVGGLAAQLHGAMRPTKDLDLCPAWDRRNLDALAAALRELGARLRIGEGSIETLEVALDAKTIAGLEIGTWRTTAGDVDVLLGIPRASVVDLARYEQLAENAAVLELDGATVIVAALEDIIRSKEIADRPADRVALPELRERLRRELAREATEREREPPDGGVGAVAPDP